MSDYNDIYSSAGQQYEVDPLYLRAMAMQESSEDPNALGPTTKSGQHAQGVMQLMPDTAKELGVKNVNEPSENIPAGAKYYAQQKTKYKDPDLALMAYNWGPGNVDSWIENGAKIDDIPKETRNHLEKVNGNYEKLKGETKVVQGEVEPVAYETDPIEQALSGSSEKNSSVPASPSVNVDPIEQALSGDVATPKKETKSSVKSTEETPSALKDIYESLPTAVTRGVGAIPQIPAYAANTAAQSMGYLYGRAHNLVSDTPYSEETLNKLSSIQPVYTGNTIADQLTKVGAAGAQSIGGDSLSPEQKQNLQGLEANGLTGDMLYEPKTLPGRLMTAAIEGGVSGPAVGAGPVVSALSGVAGEGAHEAFPNNPIAPLVAGMAPFAIKGAYNLASNQFTKKAQAAEDFPLNKIYEAAQRDLGPNAKIGDVENKLSELGPNATMADLGPNSRDLGYVTAQTPGEGAKIAENALEQRHAGQSDRITQAATKGLNVNEGDTYNKVLSTLDEQQKSAATPLYKEAFDSNKNVSDSTVNRILKTDAGQAALDFARKRMNNKMVLMGEPDPELALQAKLAGQMLKGGVAKGLKLETLDLVKQGFDDQISSLLRKGENGAARDVIELKNGLVGRLDKIDTTGFDAKGNPLPEGGKYSQARQSWAEPAQAKDALDAGFDYVSKGGNADPETLNGLTDAQKAYFKIGAANKLRDIIQDTRYGADAAKRIFKSPAQEKALSSLFDSEKEFNDFKKSVANEAEYYRTKHQVMGNSLTEPRLMAREDANLTPGQKSLKMGAKLAAHGGEFLTRNLPGKVIYGGQLLYNSLVKPQALTSEAAAKMAPMQFTPEGTANFVDAYKNYLMQQMNKPNTGGSLTFPGAGNFVVNSITSGQQQPESK